MNIKARLEKLEAKRKGNSVALLVISEGESSEEALKKWKEETGIHEPDLVLIVREYSD